MGRKGSCLSGMKKVMSPSSKEKKEKKARKKRRWFWKWNTKGLASIQEEIAVGNSAPPSSVLEASLVNAEGEQTKYVDSVVVAENEQATQAYPVSNSEIVEENQANLEMDAESEPTRQAYPVTNSEIVEENQANLTMDAESEQERHSHAVARASTAAAEATVAPSQPAAKVVRPTASARSPAKSKEEIAALKIQSVFRGRMARRTLRSIKGLVRLKTLVQGQSVKRQAMTTLRCMQTMTRIQAEVRARRIRMSEENCALQRQLQQKHYKEEKSRPSIVEDWNGSAQSKEQFEAMQQKKQEAAIKRERTLAYAYTHQQTWRNSSEPTTHTFMDPENPQWGWNWLERWMAVRPWENRAIEKEQINHTTNAKSVTSLAQARRDLDLIKKPSSQTTPKRHSITLARPSVSTPRAKTHNVKPQSNRKSVSSVENDARSTHSAQSDRCSRRHSVTRDDESVASSSALPSYMVPTESARAKSRMSFEKTVLAEKERDSAGRTKKRLSFETSPSAPRRHSVLH